jgi:ADP-heptose:LPS heptosyltransferase
MSASPVQPVVIWFGRVGDMILLSTLLDILHRRYGLPCHLIGAGSWPAELYAAHADVARVSSLHRYTAFAFDLEWWRTVRRLRASHDAPVYVCEYDRRKLARIRRLLRAGGIDPRHCLYITRTAAFTGQRHWVDRLVSFGRETPAAFSAADYPWPCPPPLCAPRLEVSAAARAACAAWLEERGWSARPLVLVQPGNRRTMRGSKLRLKPEDDKAWPIERWAALLRQLQARMPQAVLLLCGAPRESLLLSWIAAATQLPEVASAELSLPQLLALCERAHSMISVDTGPAHAAAALSLPLVVMFGAHSQQEWLPRSPTGSTVIGVGGPPDSKRLDEIPVETVLAAWCELPARPRPMARATAPGTPGEGLSDAVSATAARATAP